MCWRSPCAHTASSSRSCRTIGNKRSSDEASRANTTTAAQFFARFPELYEFVLEQLQSAATATLATLSSSTTMHPSLYPLLLLLSRLTPTYTATVATTQSMAAFTPCLLELSAVRHAMGRNMAARALASVTPSDEVVPTVAAILSRLPDDADGAAVHALTSDMLDGMLQQCCHLLKSVLALSDAGADGVLLQAAVAQARGSLIHALQRRSWLVSMLFEQRRCGYVREKGFRLQQLVEELCSGGRCLNTGVLALRRLDGVAGLQRLSLAADPGIVMELSLCGFIACKFLIDVANASGGTEGMPALVDVLSHSLFPVRAYAAKQTKHAIRKLVQASTLSGLLSLHPPTLLCFVLLMLSPLFWRGVVGNRRVCSSTICCPV